MDNANTHIDAHQHFWQYNAVTHAWIDDTMQVIKSDFLPAQLAPILQQNGFAGCIAVQADQSEKETAFLIQLAAENTCIKGVVGWVDLKAENLAERLTYFKQYPIVKGFRHVLQSEDPSFMLSASFVNGIALLQQFGYSYDLLLFPQHLTAALELVAQFPAQRFVIDHLAKPFIKNGLMGDWQKGMAALAAHPNVYCKISGMVTEADWLGWRSEDFKPYLDVVVACFGVKRIMFGSDWPVCLLAASYPQMLAIVKNYFSDYSPSDQSYLFGKNAIEFYQL